MIMVVVASRIDDCGSGQGFLVGVVPFVMGVCDLLGVEGSISSGGHRCGGSFRWWWVVVERRAQVTQTHDARVGHNLQSCEWFRGCSGEVPT